jgi:hypothetical protein
MIEVNGFFSNPLFYNEKGGSQSHPPHKSQRFNE